MRRVLLLNPPGRVRYIRDQFCSHVSKGSYYWQPLDLLLLSGQLDAAGWQVAVVDAIAERLTRDAALGRIRAFAPDAVIFLTGHDSFAEDVAFVGRLRANGVATLVGVGDILREDGERLLAQHDAVDACLNDFVTHGLTAYLAGDRERAGNMIVRTENGPVSIPAGHAPRTFTLPPPRYDLFPLSRYRMPFNRFHPYATVVSSIGCPYGCTFCPFARTPFRLRAVDDVIANLHLVARMGIRQVHFADWTFGVDRAHTAAVLEDMRAAGLSFSWSCLSRVDLVDRDLLRLFKEAGCDLIEFGIESGNQALLDRYRKQITLEQVRGTFRLAREIGVRTLATFVLGLPGETPESLQETLALALEIDPTYCSFNIATPRRGTLLRRQMIQDRLIDGDRAVSLDSSWSAPAFSTDMLPATRLARFQLHAIRRFYLRPSYLARRAMQIGSWTELRNEAGNAAALAWQVIARQKRARRTRSS